MCVVAGYIGSELAAPVLIEMLRKEQGMGGGYYTGIATVENGTLHYRKVLGDLDTLLSETDAAELPGTIGIAHGRSKSGGEREWSHPFVADCGRLAYVANGSLGRLKGRADFSAAGEAALSRGETFLSAVEEPIGDYPVLSNGSCVHMSEIMAHQIAFRLGCTGNLPAAMGHAFADLPSEVIGLSVHADLPDQIAACRVNFPLFAGHDAAGTYAASTPLAFPPGVQWVLPIAPNSVACIGSEGVKVMPLDPPIEPTSPLPSPEALSATVVAALKEGEPVTFGALCSATAPLWPENALGQAAMAVFSTLYALDREGRVSFDEVRVPGQYDRGTVPLTRVHWRG